MPAAILRIGGAIVARRRRRADATGAIPAASTSTTSGSKRPWPPAGAQGLRDLELLAARAVVLAGLAQHAEVVVRVRGGDELQVDREGLVETAEHPEGDGHVRARARVLGHARPPRP